MAVDKPSNVAHAIFFRWDTNSAAPVESFKYLTMAHIVCMGGKLERSHALPETGGLAMFLEDLANGLMLENNALWFSSTPRCEQYHAWI